MSRPHSAISQAERRILEHLELGLTNKDIAAALVLSPRTVESHISTLLSKTGCRSRTQLLLWALSRESGKG
ncbi:response regulator transcription factor [Cyanobium sp. CH-040]|uniref:response regulator transcription factor n=1 Tax=Cyanobium sp. CH-040 TaxID=2823708 RepID=UPI0020CDDAF3|nr:LuxR C-terminal-related transcriptional regulator [Cyanobium sp. CH-040]MCP9929102.1 response regulator transcription factor [Cyanobium sp. CH-040]